jgi:energy-coupling factor transporter ATP-binding protein EcfA2
VNSTNPLAIHRIDVDNLFGRYTYRLGCAGTERAADISQVMLLCGNNGSGKTTILNLLVHLLWPRRGGGHRGAIANVTFSRLSVTLGNGLSIIAERENGTTVGSFRCKVEQERHPIADAYFKAEEVQQGRYRIADDAPDDASFQKLISTIADIGLSIYFLDDDRSLVTAAAREFDRVREVFVDEDMLVYSSASRRQMRELEQEKRNNQLLLSLGRLKEWSRQQLITDSSRAEANSQTVYGEIIGRLGITTASVAPDEKQRTNLQTRLQKLTERVAPFANLGLSPVIETDSIQKELQKAPLERLPLIENILTPYIDGIELRLTALQAVQETLYSYVSNLNHFLVDKNVRFDVYAGLQVFSNGADGGRISPDHLSSGEKQLVLLLSNVVAARSQSTVFIIDEPELSLNVEWQRMLVSALLDCIKGSNVQFLMATHSMELISQHSEHVVQLVPELSND